MIDTADRSGLLALLAWYREMGADCALDESPVDWLARADHAPGHELSFHPSNTPDAGTPPPPAVSAARPPTAAARPASATPRPPPPPPAVPAPARRFPTGAPDAAETAARSAAKSARSIAELAAAIDRFEGCGLKATAKHTCVWRGTERACIMIVGEAPGREEDLEGKPFVGRAGQLLDRMLSAIGLSENDVHITNIVYWRPPGNRTPTPQEAQLCRPFLERQAELVAPEIIVLLGGAAAKNLLDAADGIMRLRGKWREITLGTARARAIATLHPAYLLRTPAAKRLAWLDLLAIRHALDATH